jgi:hypothetical protein
MSCGNVIIDQKSLAANKPRHSKYRVLFNKWREEQVLSDRQIKSPKRDPNSLPDLLKKIQGKH